MIYISDQMFYSGVLGAQFSTFGFFASSALNLTAAQTVGSFAAAAASAGFSRRATLIFINVIAKSEAMSNCRLGLGPTRMARLFCCWAKAQSTINWFAKTRKDRYF